MPGKLFIQVSCTMMPNDIIPVHSACNDAHTIRDYKQIEVRILLRYKDILTTSQSRERYRLSAQSFCVIQGRLASLSILANRFRGHQMCHVSAFQVYSSSDPDLRRLKKSAFAALRFQLLASLL